MPPGANSIARNNASVSAPAINRSLFLSIAPVHYLNQTSWPAHTKARAI